MSRREIAAALGITRKTLSKHFAAELARKPIEAAVPAVPDIGHNSLVRAWQTPLQYLLTVMNDPAADPARRDRMAVAAAPFVHAKPGDLGKKQQALLDAQDAAGTNWERLVN